METQMVALKNVRKDVWQHFKSESVRHGLTTGEFLAQLVREHEERDVSPAQIWKTVLHGHALLSAQEAEEMRSTLKDFRKGFDFRI